MIRVARVLVPVALAAFFLWLIAHLGLADFAFIGMAAVNNPAGVVQACVALIAVGLVSVVRYAFILRCFGFVHRFRDVATVSFVSLAVALWFPGAMVVSEVLRISLMTGLQEREPVGENERVVERLFLASFGDRLLGMMTYHLAGGVAGTILCLTEKDTLSLGVVVLSLYGFFVAMLLIGLPLLWRARLIGNLLRRITENGSSSASIVARFLAKIAVFSANTRDALSMALAAPQSFLPAIAFSLLLTLFSNYALVLIVRLLGGDLALLTSMAGMPVVAVSMVLPIGVGGVGGYQLIAGGIYRLLGVETSLIVSANLLLNSFQVVLFLILAVLFTVFNPKIFAQLVVHVRARGRSPVGLNGGR